VEFANEDATQSVRAAPAAIKDRAAAFRKLYSTAAKQVDALVDFAGALSTPARRREAQGLRTLYADSARRHPA